MVAKEQAVVQFSALRRHALTLLPKQFGDGVNNTGDDSGMTKTCSSIDLSGHV